MSWKAPPWLNLPMGIVVTEALGGGGARVVVILRRQDAWRRAGVERCAGEAGGGAMRGGRRLAVRCGRGGIIRSLLYLLEKKNQMNSGLYVEKSVGGGGCGALATSSFDGVKHRGRWDRSMGGGTNERRTNSSIRSRDDK